MDNNKKKLEQNDKRKPRQIQINFEVNPGSSIDISFSKEEQLLKVKGIKNGNEKAVAKIHLITGYSRPKKMKILNRTVTNFKSFDINPDNTLIKTFNVIFASDTNSEVVDGVRICAACLSILAFFSTENVYKQNLSLALVYTIEENSSINPERISWAYFTEKAVSSVEKHFPIGSSIGFIVDSEENMLEAINKRWEPIHRDFYIPDQVQLIYATSDGGKEYLSNKMIGVCESEAKVILNNILNQIKENEISVHDIPSWESPLVRKRSVNG